MVRTRTAFWLGGLLALALGGCGDDRPAAGRGGGSGGGAAAVVSDEIARLVPADAFAVVYTASLEGLETKVRSVVGSVDPEAAREVDVAKMLDQLAGPAAPHVDRSRALAIAVSPARGGGKGPSLTFLLPVRDGAAAKAAFGDAPAGAPAPVVLGKTLALSDRPGYVLPTSPSPLVQGLPGGDLVLRIDLARTVATYRADVEKALGQVTEKVDEAGMDGAAAPPGGVDPAAALTALAGSLRTLMDAAERLDVSVRIQGAAVADVEATFTAKAGSALDRAASRTGDVAAVASALPKDYPIAFVLGVPMSDLGEWLSRFTDTLLASVPEKQRAVLARSMNLSKETYALLGDASAMGMRFGGTGIEGVAVLTAKDPKAYQAKRDELMKAQSEDVLAEMGMAIEPLAPTTVEGVEVRGWRVTFDWEKMMASSGGTERLDPKALEQLSASMEGVFGKDGVRMREAIVGDRILSVFGGGDDLMAQTLAQAKRSGAKPPPVLAKALERAGERPAFVLATEMREVVSGLLDMVGKMMPEDLAGKAPHVPAGEPVPLVVYGRMQGREYRGGLTVDVAAAGRLVKALIEQTTSRRREVPDDK